ncbi:hypothetical protein F4778DRAFT_796552 [Xylariomycetidae sp. FL2044]|nr:hypothetical protein F4778DRAFT_796552 [Xylariomycetidae sp. FL2044]
MDTLSPQQNPALGWFNPDNSNSTAVGVIVLCAALGGIAVLLRVYSLLFCRKKVTVEDGTSNTGFWISCIWVLFLFKRASGFWVHQWNVQVKSMTDTLFVLFFLPMSYAFSLSFCKTAILLEWTKIFVPTGTRNAFFWICWGLILFNFLVYASAITALNLFCIPQEKIWNRWVEGHCVDRRAIDTVPAAFNIFSDLIILILPQRVIWTLQMKRIRKIGVSAIFSFGIVGCACAVGRFQSTITLHYHEDLTYEASSSLMWCIAESTCALMIFCAPTFPKAFANLGSSNGFYVSIRSWMGFSSGASSRRHLSAPLSDHHGPGSHAMPGASYRMIREKRTPRSFNDLSSFQTIESVQLVVLDPYTASPQHPRAPRPGEVIRTTEFSATTGDATSEVENYVTQRQHPWIESM